MSLRSKRILLGVTGGVAAFKAVLLLRLLTKAGAEVQVVLSPGAARFIPPLTFEALSGKPCPVDLWESTRGGGEGHIRLAQWADILCVVPAGANFMGQLAQGLCPDLLTTIATATPAPILLAPAMHDEMWRRPSVARVVETLRGDGIDFIGPVAGDLADGSGQGRMVEPEEILEAIDYTLSPKDLINQKIIISAGPTHEPLDPVRYISNHSTGRMGFELARAAASRGADVTLVAGPSALPTPLRVKRIDVLTAADMSDAVLEAFPGADCAIMAAAVADYTPERVAPQKIKKAPGPMAIPLKRTRDILHTLGKGRRPDQRLVGFAMETENLAEGAQEKLKRKGCDMIVANSLKEPGAGFGHSTNKVTFYMNNGDSKHLELMSKRDVADIILNELYPATAQSAGDLGGGDD